MKLFVLLTVYACVVINAQEEITKTQQDLPPDPLLEEDEVGEPLSPADYDLAEKIADDETEIEYSDTNRDPLENIGVDEDFLEGDISLFGQDDPQNVAIRGKSKKWPGGQVPYYISARFTSYERSIIAKAVLQYKKHTCIRFVPRSNQRNYVHIVKGGGCSSLVGRSGGAQRLTLGNGCVQIGVVVHELLHAVGFWHEQSRPDRDTHIWIYWQNIMSGVAYNFQAQPRNAVELMHLPYDLGSIMHYGKYAFSNGRGPTIVSKNGASFGQRRGLSGLDIKKINSLYQCGGPVKPTVKPTVKPGKPDKNCADNNKFCGDWSKKGECTKNPSYMKLYCRKSCRFCTTTTVTKPTKPTGSCQDLNKFCGDWSKIGECTKNAAYMKVQCKKSCGLCGGSSSCTNDNQYCDDWSKKGQCTANAAYMKISCRKACGLC